jgi:hypothetical protein
MTFLAVLKKICVIILVYYDVKFEAHLTTVKVTSLMESSVKNATSQFDFMKNIFNTRSNLWKIKTWSIISKSGTNIFGYYII